MVDKNMKKGEKKRLVFFLALGISLLFIVPFMIRDGGYFFLWNDFNHQQIPFYLSVHEAIKNGSFLWSWVTDLGASTLSSYSFYLLGSPFFWFTLIFPTDWVPFLMGPILAFKFAFTALVAYLYLKRFIRNPYYVVIASLIYTFSGFAMTSMFFNHFQEVILFFPLLLLAMEKFMVDNKKGWLVLAVAINAVVNYFFFIGEMVFLIIYLIVRVRTGDFVLNRKKFFRGVFEVLLGIGISAFLLIPSILSLMGNTRLNSQLDFLNSLIYFKSPGNYVSILTSFFFPPEIQGHMALAQSSSPWASIGGWLPLFGMVGVIGFWQIKEKSFRFVKILLIISSVLAFVPLLNSVFYLFRSEYYARWFYMPILLMALATGVALEKKVNWNKAFKYTFFSMVVLVVVVLIFPTTMTGVFQWGLYDHSQIQRVIVIITIGFLLLGFLFILFSSRDKVKGKTFSRLLLLILSMVIVVHNIYFIYIGKTIANTLDGKAFIAQNLIENRPKLPQNEGQLERIDHESRHFNLGMYWNMPSMTSFHSILSNSLYPLYNSIGSERYMLPTLTNKQYGFRALTSVRWYFSSIHEPNTTIPEKFQKEWTNEDFRQLPMAGFVFHGEQLGYNVYENKNYIPFGFIYDGYITESDYFKTPLLERDNLLLKGLVLNQQQIEKYKDYLIPVPSDLLKDTTYTQFVKDVENRKKVTGKDFKITSQGFNLSIDLPEENLVFISVPYDAGWHATINGKEVTVEKVQIGLIAVKGEMGMNEIKFTYFPPGLNVGLVITVFSTLTFAIYVFWKRKKP